ncbi:MAG: T9SS type A sorting domain-containing protein [Saprospiraceae bacterium]
MKKIKLILPFLLTICSLSLSGQRYLKQVFDSITKTNTYYGSNITVLANPTLLKVPLPVSIFTPKGDTLKKRPLVIYVHTGNFLPYPTNGGTNGKNAPPTDQYASIAQLGMGFPVDSSLIEICTRLTKMGYVTAAIDYRTGWNPIAATQGDRVNTLINAAYRGVQDLRTAIRYFKYTVLAQNNPFGIDTSRIVAWGQGTGGYITMAAATLDNYLDIVLSQDGKFIGADINGDGIPDPYVIQSIHGDIYGTAVGKHPVTGDTTSLPNFVGLSSDFQLCVNMGGAIADTSWIDASDLPLISYHEPRDPFAPYKEGIVLVPVVNLPVVKVQGSYLATQKSDKLGLQKKMRDLKLNDVITQNANKKNDGIEGLYPVNGDGQFDSDPWNWWDTTLIVAANSKNGLLTNPNMSAAKARRYIDTIIGYFAPRAFAVLGLGTFTSTPDQLKDRQVGLKMMPNPMITQTTLQTNTAFPMKGISIYDINGRLVGKTSNLNTSHFTIERRGLSQGTYFIQIGFDKGIITKPLLIQ